MRQILRERIGGRIATMRFRAAFALAVALSVPAWAQQTGHGGSASAHSAGSGHAGGTFRGGATGYGGGHGGGRGGYVNSGQSGAPSYSGLVGIQQPSSFSQPGRFPMPGRLQPPPRAGVPLPYRGNGFSGGFANGPDHRGRDPHRGPYRGHDHDRRYRNFGSYGYAPGYIYPYPYVVDPGFYDWGATDYSENGQAPYADAPPDQGPDYRYGPDAQYPATGEVPYQPQHQYAQPGPAPAQPGPQRQEYHFATASPSAPSPITSKPLTVIFRGNRAPEKMQNYMVTSTALTNLDGDHFEKIPLDQIDVAATQQANRSSGIDFQVPFASHD